MAEQVHPVLLDVRVAAASRLYKVYLKLFPCYESEYLIWLRATHQNFELPGPASVQVGPMEYPAG
jgi:hypothetical protein